MTAVTAGRIRLVVVDDHDLIRAGFTALVDSIEDFELVGEASDGAAAVEMMASLEADVVIMDLNMDGMNGIEATRRIRQANPDVAVLILSMVDDSQSLVEAIDSGAAGYLLKASATDSLPHAIRTVAAGGSAFGPEVLAKLIDARSTAQPFPQLTEREREILTYLAAGRTNSAIGHSLGISPRTVANHVSAILLKLPAIDRTDAVLKAREAGLG